MDEKKLIILVQEHECLCSLQHKDFDNSLVKDNCWKEIAGEVQAQGKEQATVFCSLQESLLMACVCVILLRQCNGFIYFS